VRVLERGTSLVDRRILHTADMLDSGFNESFYPATWSKENVLSLRSREFNREIVDELSIVNTSSQRLNYLNVWAGDRLLIFGIEPNESLLIAVSAQRNVSNIFVDVEGAFSDGRAISKKYWSFDPATMSLHASDKAKLELTIKADDVTLNLSLPNGTTVRPRSSGTY
jgi:hypothetical protein